jgi:hemolysin activation/secretion protein
MATEYSAGTSVDSIPLQHLWYVGGAGTLRGYNSGVLTGQSFWRGRAEIGYGMPAVRLVGFSDLAWAGPRDAFSNSKPLLSVGAGISMMDGILRLDVARGLREPKGWAATLYFDAAL